MKACFFLTLLLFTFYLSVFGQSNKKIYKKAEKHLFAHRYSEGLALYNSLLVENPDDPDLNFKIGFCPPEKKNR